MARQDPISRAVAGCGRRIAVLAALVLLLVTGIMACGCSVKRTVRIRVPPKILDAKSATFSELLGIIGRYDKINSLRSSSLRITLTSGKIESGRLQKYARAPGYILLKRPISMFLAVQNPLTKSAVLHFGSIGDEFSAWVPSEFKFYIGKNSARELFASDLPDSPKFTMRATHIFEAILPADLIPTLPEIRISLQEETDAEASYYVLSVFRDGPSSRIYPVRKIWIERSQLAIARHQIYLQEGQLISDIQYSGGIEVDGFVLPLKIHIDRPADGYTLDMDFRQWSVNPELPDEAFLMKPPPGAQIIALWQK